MRKLLQYSRQLRQRRQSAFSLQPEPAQAITLNPGRHPRTIHLPEQDLDVSALRRRLAESEYTDSPHHD